MVIGNEWDPEEEAKLREQFPNLREGGEMDNNIDVEQLDEDEDDDYSDSYNSEDDRSYYSRRRDRHDDRSEIEMRNTGYSQSDMRDARSRRQSRR